MSKTNSLVKRSRQQGVSSVEYIVVLVLVVITAILIFKTFGKTVVSKMTDSNNAMVNSVTTQ